MVSWQSFYNASQRVQVQMQMSSDKLWKPKCMIGSRCCRGELELILCPKKDLLTQRIGILDARCCLCDETLEACASLFFTCPMATALGFSYSWCLKSCRVRVFSNKDILKLALDPFIQEALTTHHSESLAY